MSRRIGLALSGDAVRAVVVHRGCIAWAAEASLEPGDSPAKALATLLSTVPVPRWSRPVVCAAIGPHGSQVKLVSGLPQTHDPALLKRVIAESVGAYFLKNGVPLVTAGVRPTSPGSAWASVVDRPCVEALQEACGARRWRLRLVAPTAVVLAGALTDDRYHWIDGGLVLEVARDGTGFGSVRNIPACALDAHVPPCQPVAQLARLGPQASRFADAFGAVLCTSSNPLVLDMRAVDLWTPAARRRALLFPLMLMLVAAIIALTSPFAGVWAARRARVPLANVSPEQWQVMRSTVDRLNEVTAILSEMQSFAADRSTVTATLAALARELPDGSVITELTWEDGHIQLSLLCPDATAVLAAIRRVPGAGSVELDGPVGTDGRAGRDLPRVGVRLRVSQGRTASSEAQRRW